MNVTEIKLEQEEKLQCAEGEGLQTVSTNVEQLENGQNTNKLQGGYSNLQNALVSHNVEQDTQPMQKRMRCSYNEYSFEIGKIIY
jgi:hypothetical protein